MKKVIIVGATSGIGRGLAEVFAGKDFLVGVTGRRENLLLELKNKFSDKIYISAFDVTIPGCLQKLENLSRELGGLDILVYSSGWGKSNKSLEFEIEKQTIDLNVKAFTEVMDWGFNFFLKQGYGQIVGITSIAGMISNPGGPSYSASKAFQINYLKALKLKSMQEKLRKIHVTDIRPGYVDTPMAKGDKLFWVSSVEKASEQIFKAIMNKRKTVYISKRWRIIGGIAKILPI